MIKTARDRLVADALFFVRAAAKAARKAGAPAYLRGRLTAADNALCGALDSDGGGGQAGGPDAAAGMRALAAAARGLIWDPKTRARRKVTWEQLAEALESAGDAFPRYVGRDAPAEARAALAAGAGHYAVARAREMVRNQDVTGAPTARAAAAWLADRLDGALRVLTPDKAADAESLWDKSPDRLDPAEYHRLVNENKNLWAHRPAAEPGAAAAADEGMAREYRVAYEAAIRQVKRSDAERDEWRRKFETADVEADHDDVRRVFERLRGLVNRTRPVAQPAVTWGYLAEVREEVRRAVVESYHPHGERPEPARSKAFRAGYAFAAERAVCGVLDAMTRDEVAGRAGRDPAAVLAWAHARLAGALACEGSMDAAGRPKWEPPPPAGTDPSATWHSATCHAVRRLAAGLRAVSRRPAGDEGSRSAAEARALVHAVRELAAGALGEPDAWGERVWVRTEAGGYYGYRDDQDPTPLPAMDDLCRRLDALDAALPAAGGPSPPAAWPAEFGRAADEVTRWLGVDVRPLREREPKADELEGHADWPVGGPGSFDEGSCESDESEGSDATTPADDAPAVDDALLGRLMESVYRDRAFAAGPNGPAAAAYFPVTERAAAAVARDFARRSGAGGGAPGPVTVPRSSTGWVTLVDVAPVRDDLARAADLLHAASCELEDGRTVKAAYEVGRVAMLVESARSVLGDPPVEPAGE